LLIAPISSILSIELKDSVLIDVRHIRAANELFLERDKYKELDSIKGNIIVELDYQLQEIQAIRSLQDSIIIKKSAIILNKDSLYLNNEAILKHEIKKQKRQKVISWITSALLVAILVL
jgi:hypothetical protein